MRQPPASSFASHSKGPFKLVFVLCSTQASGRYRFRAPLVGYRKVACHVSSGWSKSKDRRKRLLSSRIPRVRLKCGELFADIIRDRRVRPPIFFCVAQRQGSREILFLGQFRSQREAKLAARQFFSDYLGRHVEGEPAA